MEGSFQRFATDHIDLDYLHRPDWTPPIEDTLATLQDLVDEGKVGQLGQSNCAAWQVIEMLYTPERKGWLPIAFLQPMYNLISRRLDEAYATFYKRHPLQTLVCNPLAGQLLTGERHQAAGPGEDTRFAHEQLPC